MRTVICHFYNEEYLLPFWLKHHTKIFDYGILIDYHSTDSSRKICSKLAPNWKLVKSKNKIFDAALCDLEVSEYEKKISGWKIALNITEFFICPNIYDIERECERLNLSGFRTKGLVVVDNRPDLKVKKNTPLITQKNYGFLEEKYDFNINKLDWYTSPSRGRIYHRNTTGIYFPGRHKSFLSRLPTLKDSAYIMWYGFSPWSNEFISRKRQISSKVSAEDITRGWGNQHHLDYEHLNNVRSVFLKQSYDLKDILEESIIKRDSYFLDISKDEVLYDDFGLANIRIEQLKNVLNDTKKNLHDSEKALKEILESRSWKITAPLRFIYRKLIVIFYLLKALTH